MSVSGLQSVVQNTDTFSNVDGGIYQSYICNLDDVTDITFTSGVLTGITVGTVGSFKKFVFDDDNSAFYNQEGSFSGTRFTNAQSAFMKFSGLSAARATAADCARQAYRVIAFHFLNDCSVMVQGVEEGAGCDSANFKHSRVPARIAPSVKSNTSDTESALEFSITSEARSIVPVDPTTITSAVLDAL